MLVAVVAARAAAGPPGAKVLFDEGRTLASEGDFVGACEKFTRSYELEPEPGTELNLADCHLHLGHVAKAWHLYDDAATRWSRTHDLREKFAREHADALVPKLGTVVVRIAEPRRKGLAISIGGHAVAAAAEVRELVDPAPVDVVVTAPDVPAFTRSASPTAGQTITIDVPAFSEHAEAPLPETPPATDDGRRSRLYLATGLGAAGAVTLVVAMGVGLSARADYNAEITSHRCAGSPPVCQDTAAFNALRDAEHKADLATYIGIGGGVVIAAALVVYATAPHAVTVTPTASATTAGLAISGRF